MQNIIFKLAAAALLPTLLAGQAQAFNLVVDSFNYSDSTTSSTTFVNASILGGESDFVLSNQANISLTAPISIAAGELSIGPATAVGTNGFGLLNVYYDGTEADPEINFGLNLDLDTATAIEIDVVSVVGSVALAPTIYTNSLNRLGPTVLTSITAPGTYRFEFVDWTETGTVDLGDINAIRVQFQFNPTESITLGEIRVVPEPATAAFCLLSLPLFLRRKRN